MKDIEDIQKDFEFIENKVKAVLFFGSSSRGKETKRDDRNKEEMAEGAI